MRKFIAVAGIVLAAACADTTGPAGYERQYTIDVPGNDLGTPGCTSIDLISCFAILDNQVKILYEKSAWAARFGEAEYQVITGSNKELASVFQAETMTVAEALRALDRFIAALENGYARDELSECWGEYLIGYASWIRGKVAARDVNVADAPAQGCLVSPVRSVTVSASTASGVVLTLDDPWHFSGDPYGRYATRTYFVIQGPQGEVTTEAVEQNGPAHVMVTDAATNLAGIYAYSVMQCSDWGYCSEPFTFDVEVVDGPAAPPCVQNHRDKGPGKPALPICKKSKKQ